MNHVLVTGGAGFIGSCVVRGLVSAGHDVTTLDALTYAGHVESLGEALDAPNHSLKVADIRDGEAVRRIMSASRPDAVIHLAAESHVDRSIDSPMDFVTTNVQGTVTLLQAATEYRNGLNTRAREAFRFLHVSTDEVYGSLGATGVFTDATPYRPNSPYSASKAGLGPLRPGVVAHVRAADHHQPLLQQLWSLADAGEADPGHHPGRPGGKARPGLRRRRECT